MTTTTIAELVRRSYLPARLKLDKAFQPCPVEPGEEYFANGIFEFNVTRLLAFVETQVELFPIERVVVGDIPEHGRQSLNEEAIRSADLLRPILLAEISPGRFNLIDGNHRVAKARREEVRTLPAHRVACPHHVPFLTSTRAYQSYVEYWNEKVTQHRR